MGKGRGATVKTRGRTVYEWLSHRTVSLKDWRANKDGVRAQTKADLWNELKTAMVATGRISLDDRPSYRTSLNLDRRNVEVVGSIDVIYVGRRRCKSSAVKHLLRTVELWAKDGGKVWL